jgi:hypothetical protein
MLESAPEFRSRHAHAVSVSVCTWPPQDGVDHSAGHPDHGDATIRGGAGVNGGSVAATVTP